MATNVVVMGNKYTWNSIWGGNYCQFHICIVQRSTIAVGILHENKGVQRKLDRMDCIYQIWHLRNMLKQMGHLITECNSKAFITKKKNNTFTGKRLCNCSMALLRTKQPQTGLHPPAILFLGHFCGIIGCQIRQTMHVPNVVRLPRHGDVA